MRLQICKNLAMLILIFLFLPLASEAQERNSTVVFRNVTLIDMTSDRPKPNMTVIVSGNRISKIGKNLKIPKDAQIIDARGKFLIPGLWDMHTHFTSNENNLLLFVANGVTGVRDMGSIVIEPDGRDGFSYAGRERMLDSILGARESIAAGKIVGPRIFTAGLILNGPLPPEVPFTLPFQLVVTSDKEARRAVDYLIERKVNFIKIHALLSREAYFAIADEAKKKKVRFEGHVPRSVNAAEASDAGQASIEHLTGVEEYISEGVPKGDKAAADRKTAELFALFAWNGTWHVPTLVSFQGFDAAKELYASPAREPRMKYIRPELVSWWKKYFPPEMFAGEDPPGEPTLVQKLSDLTGKMSKAEVKIMAGTDFGGPFVYPGFSLHDELVLLNHAGLTPLMSLQAATLNPANFLGISASFGTVEPGKVADLVLLDANPLDDISNTKKINAVVLNGRLFDRKALDKMLADVEAAANKK